MGMVSQAVASAFGRPALTVLLGGVILWQCAECTGRAKARAVIFVSNLPADLVVDHAVYHVEDLGRSPIVCELRPGRHSARLIQDGRVIYQEEFTVAAGEETILKAWDGFEDGRSPGRGRASSSVLLWAEP